MLITAAYGLDTTWMGSGSCYGWGSGRPGHPTPWQVATPRMVEYALINCRGCHAQYDCAGYAIQAKMIAGTWSMPITQLRWLQAEPDGLDLVSMARELQAPMQEVARAAYDGRPT